MEITEIMQHLPHRYPFLLVDRVLELVPNEHIAAIKNVTMNEPHFPGHFPHHPVMPGVLIIEAMAQAAGLLAFKSTDKETTENTVIYFVVIKNMRGIWKFETRALVDGQVASEAELMCTLRDLV